MCASLCICVYSYSHYKSYSHSVTRHDGRSQCSNCSYTCCTTTTTTTTTTGDRCGGGGGGSLTFSKKRCGMMSNFELLITYNCCVIFRKGSFVTVSYSLVINFYIY